MGIAPGLIIRGRYRVVELLGDRGNTWKVQDVQGGRSLALKQLTTGAGRPDTDQVSAEVARYRELTALGLPALVDVVALDDAGTPQLFVLRELVAGESLETIVRRQGGLSPELLRRVAGVLLAWVEALHGAGAVHGEISPQNVILDLQNDRLSVVDWPALKAVARSNAGRGWSLALDPEFGAPEARMGGPKARSDLYSIGMTLAWAAAGGEPLPRDGAEELLAKDLGLGGDLARFVLKLREPLVEGRFHDAAEARRALEAGGVAARPQAGKAVETRLEPVRGSGGRGLAALGGLLALLPFAFTSWLVFPSSFSGAEGIFRLLLTAVVALYGLGTVGAAMRWVNGLFLNTLIFRKDGLVVLGPSSRAEMPWNAFWRIRRVGPILMVHGGWKGDSTQLSSGGAVAIAPVYEIDGAELERRLLELKRGEDPEEKLAQRRAVASLPGAVRFGLGGSALMVPIAGLLLVLGGDWVGEIQTSIEASSAAPPGEAPDGAQAEGANPGAEPLLCPPGWKSSTESGSAGAVPGCESDKGGVAVGVSAQDARFLIDRTEVTVAAYAACVEAGACTPAGQEAGCNAGSSARDRHPINCVTLEQAEAFCRSGGAHLCSDAQWTLAAAGSAGASYPWGEAAPTCQLAVMDEGGPGCGKGGTWPVGARPQGLSTTGVLDVSGNVAEWVSGGGVRGGHFGSRASDLRVDAGQRGAAGPEVGFRCCR